jgi:CBS domain-containing protein
VAEQEDRLTDVVSAIATEERPTFAVLKERTLVGILPPKQLAATGDWKGRAPIVSELMTSNPRVVYPQDDLYGTLDLFRHHDSDVLPVVNRESGEFLGMLTRGAILRALRERLREQRIHLLREHAGFSILAHETLLESLLSELSPHAGGTVRQLGVPGDAVGKSLSDVKFRDRFGCQVIAVRKSAGDWVTPPDPHQALEREDVLVVFLAEGREPWKGAETVTSAPPAGSKD